MKTYRILKKFVTERLPKFLCVKSQFSPKDSFFLLYFPHRIPLPLKIGALHLHLFYLLVAVPPTHTPMCRGLKKGLTRKLKYKVDWQEAHFFSKLHPHSIFSLNCILTLMKDSCQKH